MSELVDEIPHEELVTWLAVAWIDGWGEDYQRTAQVVKELHDIVNLILIYFKANVGEADIKSVEQCMPRQARPIRRKVTEQPEGEEEQTEDSTTRWMKNAAGVTKTNG